MKITEVHLNSFLTEPLGLRPIHMHKIGQTVLLAGKNGSGKTRLLNLIREQAESLHKVQQQKERAEESIKNFQQQKLMYERQLSRLGLNAENKTGFEERISNCDREICRLQDVLDEPESIISDFGSQKIPVIDFVPNQVHLADWSSVSKAEWMKRADTAHQLGVSQLPQATLPLVQQIVERWVHTTHPRFRHSEEDKTSAETDYLRLQAIIRSFLGTEIGWNKDGYSTIFDMPIAQAHLSAGQKVLLQLCVAIFAQGGSLSKYIVFMDEPENHLHPSAVVDLLDTIGKHNPDGQVWIATHSIPLLSHFDASSLWFVEDGTIKHSGKKPEAVLKSLLGDDEQIYKLRDFTSLPDELARNRFAFECLCPPEVVETGSNDPQSLQLNEQLKIIWKNKGTINLLDFGAGKGRMIANLADYENVSSEKLNYYAFDLSGSDKECCLKNITLSYKDKITRYYNSIETLRADTGDHYFDVVVLSNVFHEIPHSAWCETLSDISKLLKDDGYLLLIEDCRIPVGELPHTNGFVVFSTLHLKKLLTIPANEKKFIAHDARFDSAEQRGRLMAHLIPSQYLKNISSETIKDALKELKCSARTEIRRIRSGSKNYANGLAHSFWIQQLANATLSLSELGGEL